MGRDVREELIEGGLFRVYMEGQKWLNEVESANETKFETHDPRSQLRKGIK